jgi:indolepyruvate ferredoxin oxidoreductase alpha subunit
VLCPGCPHRSVFYVLKRLKLTVCGDIGCYTLGALPPLEAMDTCVCMGASIGVAHGMNKARGVSFAQKTVAVIGDSTFLHSGITGLIDVVYNKGDTTVLILDNSITGMTGHQQNPATGYTIRGEETHCVDLEALCRAVGVPSVRIVDPFDIEALETSVREETQRPGPSVIIVRRPCALISSYKPESEVWIDPAVCSRCKMCMGISCAAISDKDGRMEINAALCARCGLCARICKFGAIKKRID